MLGHSTPETLLARGSMKNKELKISIDCGSMHNFIQHRLVKFLGLPSSPSFQILVGNGEQLTCTSVCSNLPVTSGKTQFYHDFCILLINGAEVVLGIHWLNSRSYNHWLLQPHYEVYLGKLEYRFAWNYCTTLEEISSTQLKRMEATVSLAPFYHLAMSNVPSYSISNFSSSPSFSLSYRNSRFSFKNLRNFHR